MKSKVWLIILAIVLVLAGGAAFFIFGSKKNTEVLPSPLIESNVPTAPPTSPKILTWNDQAGFSFQYPDGLTINKHDEDVTNYAHIDFISSNNKSSVLVLASDTKYKTIDEWVKNDKSVLGASAIDSTLGDKPSKKVLSSDGGSISIGTIDSGILFTISTIAYKDTEIKSVFDKISSTFVFVVPTSAASKSAPATSTQDSGGIIEEEETIQ